MDEKSLSISQVLAVTNIEYLISVLYENSEYYFSGIIELIDKHKIMEHKDTMIYLHDLLRSKGYVDYADELAKKYDIRTEKT